MAPTDKIRLPLRWQFIPVKATEDGSIRWEWRAFTQTGQLAMQSHAAFETLTECIEDARSHGYGS
jgi:hypothetical protein